MTLPLKKYTLTQGSKQVIAAQTQILKYNFQGQYHYLKTLYFT